jgi:hypothetical protein
MRPKHPTSRCQYAWSNKQGRLADKDVCRMLVNENIELCDPLITHGIATVSLYMTHGHSVEGGLVWYMDGSKTNKDTSAGVYI